MILWDNIAGTWRRTPKTVEVQPQGIRITPQTYATQGKWSELADWNIYEQLNETGQAPLGYLAPVVQVDGDRTYAYRAMAGTPESRAEEGRRQLALQIDGNRREKDVAQIDLAADPGLQGQLDEANAAAQVRLDALDATADEDLAAFDTDLDPLVVGAVATARSLISQEQAMYNEPGVTAAQVTALDDAIALQTAVIDAGDDSADVPPPPTFARLNVGVVAEDYGIMTSGRYEQGGWWYPVFTLKTERELDIADHFIAIYGESAVDDASDTATGYLSTIGMTDEGGGVYSVSGAASGLARAKDFVFKFTLCRGHLSKPWFDKITIPANVEKQRTKVRWAGNVIAPGD